MSRRWIAVAALFAGVAVLLVFAVSRVGERQRIADAGRAVLMPLAPLGPRDLSLGDRIELVYDLPEIQAELRAGTQPAEGAIRVALDDADIVLSAKFADPGTPGDRDVIVAYRFASAGPGLWPSDRPRLSFGDGFYLVGAGRIADYLGARYAVLQVDETGSSVVVGLADGDGNPIQPGS